jgi:hypothetical protein
MRVQAIETPHATNSPLVARVQAWTGAILISRKVHADCAGLLAQAMAAPLTVINPMRASAGSIGRT